MELQNDTRPEVQVATRLTAEDAERLGEIARALDRSVASLLRLMVRERIEREPVA